MTRFVWMVSAVLVASRAVADMVTPCDMTCDDLDPSRVGALILIALFVTALAVGYIRRPSE